ncbi:MAG: hypothetical protein ACLUKN_04455 [Bacilli bacterium]
MAISFQRKPLVQACNWHIRADFITDFGRTSLIGASIDSADISKASGRAHTATRSGFGKAANLSAFARLENTKNLRKLLPKRDEMVMMNTWGDRAQDTKVTESFCLNEIRLAAKMGITHFR